MLFDWRILTLLFKNWLVRGFGVLGSRVSFVTDPAKDQQPVDIV